MPLPSQTEQQPLPSPPTASLGLSPAPCSGRENRKPPLLWEERTGGGKAWPGLPVTLQNSFEAQQREREPGKCAALWLQETLVPPELPARIDNPKPRPRAAPGTCSRGWELAPLPPLLLRLNIHFISRLQRGKVSPDRSWKQCHRPQPPFKKIEKKPKNYFYISLCFLKEKSSFCSSGNAHILLAAQGGAPWIFPGSMKQQARWK